MFFLAVCCVCVRSFARSFARSFVWLKAVHESSSALRCDCLSFGDSHTLRGVKRQMKSAMLTALVALAVSSSGADAFKIVRDAHGVRAEIDPENASADLQQLEEHTKAVADNRFEQLAKRKKGRAASGTTEEADRRFLVAVDLEKQFLDMHNEQRASIAAGDISGQPSATNMNELLWDAGLASVAQTYADKCHYDHNDNRGTEFRTIADAGGASFVVNDMSDSVGENIFATTQKTNLAGVVTWGMGAWFDEHEFYTYSTRKCDDGEQCGHYTAIVWAETRYVGCGMAVCDNITGITQTWENNGGTFGVCNYAQGGNDGSFPYTEGTPCTDCASDRQDVCQDEALCGGCVRSDFDACQDMYASGCDTGWCGDDCYYGCEEDPEDPCWSACYGCYDTCNVCEESSPPACCSNGVGDSIGRDCSSGTTTASGSDLGSGATTTVFTDASSSVSIATVTLVAVAAIAAASI